MFFITNVSANITFEKCDYSRIIILSIYFMDIFFFLVSTSSEIFDFTFHNKNLLKKN